MTGFNVALIAAAALALAGPAMAQPPPGPPATLAGEPGKADLDRWADDGAVHVISLLTPDETAALDYDISAAAQSRGLAYSALPVDARSDGATADALAAILADADGPVVIACGSGRRSSHLYAASLIRSGALTPDELDRIDPDMRWSPALLARLSADPAPEDSNPARIRPD